MTLTKSIWDKKQYNYLTKADSVRYDEVKDSQDPKDQEIKGLILQKAASSRASHCASTY